MVFENINELSRHNPFLGMKQNTKIQEQNQDLSLSLSPLSPLDIFLSFSLYLPPISPSSSPYKSSPT